MALRTDIPRQAPLITEASGIPIRYAKKLNKSNGGTGVPMVYIDGPKVFTQIAQVSKELTSNSLSTTTRAQLLATLPSVRTTFHLQPPEEQKFPSATGKLPLFIKLSSDQVAATQAFDTKIKADIAELTPTWFNNKTMSAEMVENVYLPIVRQYPQSVEVPDHEKDLCAKVSIYEGSGTRPGVEVLVQDSEDFTQFRPGSIHDLQRNAPIIPVLNYSGLWFNNKGTEVGPNMSAPRILVFYQPSSTEMPAINVEPGAEFHLLDAFTPETATAADPPELVTAQPHADELTMIAGGGEAQMPQF